ncbi:MAG: hypothetical protein A2W99_17290 [Bacteroidetes bacterium GWF2_33_16]|nr:MAG: hypothetical protein A2X00_13505 [Bacteroidetes bacterium GWE2_32_14]OFY03502.1 MAG: hypothetical protein A2W99_17290 [Bacteroidetes bacterium GWF2_33_16]
MKSNKNFNKAKKPRPFDNESELRGKKVVPLLKKDKYFKKEIFNEIDEFEDIEEYDSDQDLEDFDEIEDDSYLDEDEDE